MPRRSFVCRCEDVTVAELEGAVERGLRTVEELKRYTGLGTGPCQGKECLTMLVRWMLARGLTTESDVQPFTARPPAEPITFGALAGPRDTPSREKP